MQKQCLSGELFTFWGRRAKYSRSERHKVHMMKETKLFCNLSQPMHFSTRYINVNTSDCIYWSERFESASRKWVKRQTQTDPNHNTKNKRPFKNKRNTSITFNDFDAVWQIAGFYENVVPVHFNFNLGLTLV